jgi:hypothetical protein
MSPSKGGFMSQRGGDSPTKAKTVKIDSFAKKTMDTTSTHGGILKSNYDVCSENKSFTGPRTTFNIDGADLKAN